MVGTGLILEGGGMRGLYTCGVLDYFLERELTFSNIYGVSAGACHACSYISKQPGRAMRTALDYLDDKRYASMYSFLRTGDFFGVNLSYNLIPNELLPFDFETFKKSRCNFYAVTTNCTTGQTEYLPVKDLRVDMNIIRASSSLPLLSRMVRIGDKKYLDGGISDSIPLARAIADGNEKNVVILTQHEGFRKEPNNMMTLMRARYKRYSELTQSIALRHEKYNETLDLLESQQEQGKAFVIRPKDPVELTRLEKDSTKLIALYESGRRDAEELYDALDSFLDLKVTVD